MTELKLDKLRTSHNTEPISSLSLRGGREESRLRGRGPPFSSSGLHVPSPRTNAAVKRERSCLQSGSSVEWTPEDPLRHGSSRAPPFLNKKGDGREQWSFTVLALTAR